MTEEEQARALARWLDDPSGPPPQDVDPDVLEAVALLRPDLAPPHAVTADSVLSSVEEPRTVEVLHQPNWSRWLGGAGGVGVLLAAAISGVVFLPSAPWLSSNDTNLVPRGMEQEMFAEALDVGAEGIEPSPEAQMEVPATPDKGSTRTPVAGKPSPAPPAVGNPTTPPKTPVDTIAVPPASRAPKMAETVRPPPTPDPLSADAVPLRAEGAFDLKVAAQLGGTQEADGLTNAPMYAERSVERSPTPLAASKAAEAPEDVRRTPATRSAKRRMMDADPMADEAAPQGGGDIDGDEDLPATGDPLLLLRQEVVYRLGPFPAHTEGDGQERALLHSARAALDEGDPNRALLLCTEALAIGNGPTPERRWLALVEGDAFRALNRAEEAESSYRAAMTGKVR